MISSSKKRRKADNQLSIINSFNPCKSWSCHVPYSVGYWKAAVYKKGDLPSLVQTTSLLTRSNRLFFSDEFLKGRIRDQKNKKNGKIGSGGLAQAKCYEKQVCYALRPLIFSFRREMEQSQQKVTIGWDKVRRELMQQCFSRETGCLPLCVRDQALNSTGMDNSSLLVGNPSSQNLKPNFLEALAPVPGYTLPCLRPGRET